MAHWAVLSAPPGRQKGPAVRPASWWRFALPQTLDRTSTSPPRMPSTGGRTAPPVPPLESGPSVPVRQSGAPATAAEAGVRAGDPGLDRALASLRPPGLGLSPPLRPGGRLPVDSCTNVCSMSVHHHEAATAGRGRRNAEAVAVGRDRDLARNAHAGAARGSLSAMGRATAREGGPRQRQHPPGHPGRGIPRQVYVGPSAAHRFLARVPWRFIEALPWLDPARGRRRAAATRTPGTDGAATPEGASPRPSGASSQA